MEHDHELNTDDISSVSNMNGDTVQLAKTIQQQTYYQMNPPPLLNQMTTIVRPIKNTHVLYVCSEEQWKQKVTDYIQLTDMFTYLGPDVQLILNNKNEHIAKTLNELYACHAITGDQYDEMIAFQQSAMLEVNKLDFILELSHNAEIIIQPTMTCSAKEPMKKIAYFINHLLQPWIERCIHSRSHFPTGYEAIQALENYTQQGYLQSTTQFVKLDIPHLMTTLPHHVLVQTLEKFLDRYVIDRHIEGISMTTIIQLVQLILDHQFCVYENVLYQLTLSGSSTSSLIIGLIDIYLDYLFEEFSSILLQKKEVYGRTLEQMMFTWNGSHEELFRHLQQTIMSHSNDSYRPKTIMITISDKIHYLDAHIGHHQGVLHTKVYHHLSLEPEALPYVFGTTSTSSSSPLALLQAAYRRAFLYCSNGIEFETERMYIDCSFQHNNFSLSWIYQTFADLVAQFDYSIPEDTFIDETNYHCLRERLRQYQQKLTYTQRQGRHRRQRRRHFDRT